MSIKMEKREDGTYLILDCEHDDEKLSMHAIAQMGAGHSLDYICPKCGTRTLVLVADYRAAQERK